MSLEALERSDLSRLPGGIFTRAFIRAYAEEVGLDPDRTMQEFIAELPPEAATVSVHSSVVEDGEKLESDRKAVTTAVRLAALSLPIIGLMLYYGRMHAPATVEPEAVAVEQVAPPASSLPAATVPEPVPAGTASVPENASDLIMEIAPRAACWVSVTADGEAIFSGLMNAGEKRIVTAKEQITFNAGDAGAFAYSLNGRPGRPVGAPGEVVSRRITRSNLSEFVTP